MNYTSQNLVICFKGFYGSGTKDDCILGPLPDSKNAEFDQFQRIPLLETIVQYNVPTIKTRMDCYLSISYQHKGGYVSSAPSLSNRVMSEPTANNIPLPVCIFCSQTTLALIKFGPLSVLYVYTPVEGTVVSSCSDTFKDSGNQAQ